MWNLTRSLHEKYLGIILKAIWDDAKGNKRLTASLLGIYACKSGTNHKIPKFNVNHFNVFGSLLTLTYRGLTVHMCINEVLSNQGDTAKYLNCLTYAQTSEHPNIRNLTNTNIKHTKYQKNNKRRFKQGQIKKEMIETSGTEMLL